MNPNPAGDGAPAPASPSLNPCRTRTNQTTHTHPRRGLCSGGFYVRSLISDVARACGGRAHMTALLRVKQGPFGLVDCLAQDEWEFDRLCAGIVATSAKAGLDAGAMKPACVGTRVAAPPENLP